MLTFLDSVWWTPSGQASDSQSQVDLLIKDITERDAGLYVCVSEKQEVVSVFNLQISKIGGARRKARSLDRTVEKIFKSCKESPVERSKSIHEVNYGSGLPG